MTDRHLQTVPSLTLNLLWWLSGMISLSGQLQQLPMAPLTHHWTPAQKKRCAKRNSWDGEVQEGQQIQFINITQCCVCYAVVYLEVGKTKKTSICPISINAVTEWNMRLLWSSSRERSNAHLHPAINSSARLADTHCRHSSTALPACLRVWGREISFLWRHKHTK